MKESMYHVTGDGRHWVVLAECKCTARAKVLREVPDLSEFVRECPDEELDVTPTENGDFTEICSEVKVAW